MRYHFENIMIICDILSNVIDDWLFVSRLRTSEASGEPRAGRIENGRDLTHDVATKIVLVGSDKIIFHGISQL